MYFSNDAGRRVRLTLRNVREDISADEVSQVMELIISKDIFYPSLTSIIGAEIEGRTVNEL